MKKEISKSQLRLRTLTDGELEHSLGKFIGIHSQVFTHILEHIIEVERRDLHLRREKSTIAKYLVARYGCSESSAYRWMETARAANELPELKEKLEKGTINVSQITFAEKSFKAAEKLFKTEITPEQKAELYSELESKTVWESQRIVDEHLELPLREGSVKEQHRRNKSVDIHLNVPEELYEKFQYVRNLYAHKAPGADWLKVFQLMADDVISLRCPIEIAKRRRQGKEKRARKAAEVKKAKQAKAQQDATTRSKADAHKKEKSSAAGANPEKSQGRSKTQQERGTRALRNETRKSPERRNQKLDHLKSEDQVKNRDHIEYQNHVKNQNLPKDSDVSPPQKENSPPSPPSKVTHRFPKIGITPKTTSETATTDKAAYRDATTAKAASQPKTQRKPKQTRAEIKSIVFQRDQSRCQFKGQDGHICGSEYLTQVDHVIPVFAGGKYTPENLRVLCGAHNRFRYRNGCNQKKH